MLMENADIDLMTAFMLDRVQKGKSLTTEAIRHLRKLGLIEGRKPNYYISKTVAKAIHQEVEYTDMSGFDDTWYRDLIVKALNEHGRLRRKDFDRLLIPKLPEILTENQKKNKIDYLLKVLREEGAIKASKDRYWEVVNKP